MKGENVDGKNDMPTLRDLLIYIEGTIATLEKAEISLYAMLQSPNPNIMRAPVIINNQVIIALIDLDITHNFIHFMMAKKMGLCIRTKLIRVRMNMKIRFGVRVDD